VVKSYTGVKSKKIPEKIEKPSTILKMAKKIVFLSFKMFQGQRKLRGNKKYCLKLLN
jgi:hypothetical protein